jgi:hypothetical protein
MKQNSIHIGRLYDSKETLVFLIHSIVGACKGERECVCERII